MARKKKKLKNLICIVCKTKSEDSERDWETKNEIAVCEFCLNCCDCFERVKENHRTGWQGSSRSCINCHETHLAEVVRLRKTKVYRQFETAEYTPMIRRSTLTFKIKHFVRFEKEFSKTQVGNAVRVIEVGFFYLRNASIFNRLSQSGFSYNRLDPSSIERKDLKQWHPTAQRVIEMPDRTGSYGSDGEMIEKYIKKLRGRGWKVVAAFDMHGKCGHVMQSNRLSIHDEEKEGQKEIIDENLGRRHENKIERINDKYNDRKYGQNWLTESTRRDS